MQPYYKHNHKQKHKIFEARQLKMGIPVLQTLHFHSDHSWVPTCLNPILVTPSFEQNVFYKFFMMKH